MEYQTCMCLIQDTFFTQPILLQQTRAGRVLDTVYSVVLTEGIS